MLRLDETFYNPVKHMLKDKKKVLGAWLQMASPYAAEIFAKSGLDVVMVDMEHGPNDILSLIDQLRAIGHFNAVPFVRAPWNDMVIIKRILDAGAYGILFILATFIVFLIFEWLLRRFGLSKRTDLYG